MVQDGVEVIFKVLGSDELGHLGAPCVNGVSVAVVWVVCSCECVDNGGSGLGGGRTLCLLAADEKHLRRSVSLRIPSLQHVFGPVHFHTRNVNMVGDGKTSGACKRRGASHLELALAISRER